MVRVRNVVASRRRKKRIRKLAKGFYGDRKNHLRLTTEAVMRALAFNYRHRKHNKRNFRRLWIMRIGIAAKINGISYSQLMHGLKEMKSDLNRKMLADMAVKDAAAFAHIAQAAKTFLSEKAA